VTFFATVLSTTAPSTEALLVAAENSASAYAWLPAPVDVVDTCVLVVLMTMVRGSAASEVMVKHC